MSDYESDSYSGSDDDLEEDVDEKQLEHKTSNIEDNSSDDDDDDEELEGSETRDLDEQDEDEVESPEIRNAILGIHDEDYDDTDNEDNQNLEEEEPVAVGDEDIYVPTITTPRRSTLLDYFTYFVKNSVTELSEQTYITYRMTNRLYVIGIYWRDYLLPLAIDHPTREFHTYAINKKKGDKILPLVIHKWKITGKKYTIEFDDNIFELRRHSIDRDPFSVDPFSINNRLLLHKWLKGGIRQKLNSSTLIVPIKYLSPYILTDNMLHQLLYNPEVASHLNQFTDESDESDYSGVSKNSLYKLLRTYPLDGYKIPVTYTLPKPEVFKSTMTELPADDTKTIGVQCKSQLTLDYLNKYEWIPDQNVVAIIVPMPDGTYYIECYTRDEIMEFEEDVDGDVILPHSGYKIPSKSVSYRALQRFRFFRYRFNDVIALRALGSVDPVVLQPLTKADFLARKYDNFLFTATADEVQYANYIGGTYELTNIHNLGKYELKNRSKNKNKNKNNPLTSGSR